MFYYVSLQVEWVNLMYFIFSVYTINAYCKNSNIIAFDNVNNESLL